MSRGLARSVASVWTARAARSPFRFTPSVSSIAWPVVGRLPRPLSIGAGAGRLLRSSPRFGGPPGELRPVGGALVVVVAVGRPEVGWPILVVTAVFAATVLHRALLVVAGPGSPLSGRTIALPPVSKD